MKLCVHTRGESNAGGKPGVYLVCHPEQTALVIPLLSEDILRHANCAIWYDSEPESSYDVQELWNALNKIQLFVVAVTSKFLYADHRARNVELKYALEQHIPVLPVLFESGLVREFNRITDTIIRGVDRTENDPTATSYEDVLDSYLKSVLVSHSLGWIDKKENDGSARNRYFMGLAYLSGIDAQINRSKALELLESAAEDPEPCLDATEKLVDMYLFGIGVSLDIEKAIFWQEKLCKQLQTEYKIGHSPDEHLDVGTRYFHALISLSDILRIAGQLPQAISTAKQALQAAEELASEVGKQESDRNIAMVYDRLSSLYCEIMEWEDAKKYSRNAMDIYAKLAGEQGTVRARRDLSVSQEKLGDIYQKCNELDPAEALYRDALSIREALSMSDHSPNVRRDISEIRTKLGDIRKAQNDYDSAAEEYAAALQFDSELAKGLGTWQARDACAVSLVRLGDIRRYQGEYHEAVELHHRAAVLLQELVDETGSIQYRKNLATALEKLAKSWIGFYQPEQAERCYERALRLREDLVYEHPSHTSRHELATTCFLFADLNCDSDMMRNALRLWEEMCPSHPEYQIYVDNARRMLAKWR